MLLGSTAATSHCCSSAVSELIFSLKTKKNPGWEGWHRFGPLPSTPLPPTRSLEKFSLQKNCFWSKRWLSRQPQHSIRLEKPDPLLYLCCFKFVERKVSQQKFRLERKKRWRHFKRFFNRRYFLFFREKRWTLQLLLKLFLLQHFLAKKIKTSQKVNFFGERKEKQEN